MFRTISLAILSGLLLWAAWPVDGFPFLLFIAFVPLLLLENELQKRKSVFAHTFLAFMLWNILTTFWIVHATWFGVMMAVLINSLLMASAFTLFSWIKSRLGIKRGWWGHDAGFPSAFGRKQAEYARLRAEEEEDYKKDG